jgi:hypothetical protein
MKERKWHEKYREGEEILMRKDDLRVNMYHNHGLINRREGDKEKKGRKEKNRKYIRKHPNYMYGKEGSIKRRKRRKRQLL